MLFSKWAVVLPSVVEFLVRPLGTPLREFSNVESSSSRVELSLSRVGLSLWFASELLPFEFVLLRCEPAS